MEEANGERMRRRDVVHLVSRALSIIYAVCATSETTYLPERLFSFLHYTNESSPAAARGAATYLPTLYQVSFGFLFLRIAIYLTLSAAFWNCPGWIERILQAEREP